MNTMEVLTLLLVVFAALSYIITKRNKHPLPPKVWMLISYNILILRANRIITSGSLSK